MASEEVEKKEKVSPPQEEAAAETSTETQASAVASDEKPEGRIAKFFKLKENRTKLTTEVVAGVATFFTMVYIIFVNPSMLSQVNGLPWGAVFLATIISAVVGTLIMGLFANVPYAQAPGMGLNAFFTFTVCMGFGFSWQAALAMVFLCGLINITITVTRIRKQLIKAIPKNLQSAIGAGIGLFIAYIGFKNANLIKFTIDPGHWVESFGTIFADGSAVPALANLASPEMLVALFGVILTVILIVKKVKGNILIGIGASTVLAAIFSVIPGWKNAVIDFSQVRFDGASFTGPFKDLGTTFGAAFYQGFPDLFSDLSMLPIALVAIFAFSLTDTFDTIGTFIGTGKRTGIFTQEDEDALANSKGFKTKMDRALLADACATSIGAIFGTSNTTTYIESAAGIEAGGRTGLTSVVTAILFALCIFISPIAGIVPAAATAPALIVIGIMMMGSLKEIDWANFEEATPAFFALLMMVITYNISIGIAFGFIFHVIIQLVTKRYKEIHPIMYVSSGLFVVYFILMAFFG